jgi:hypothetical protein
VATQTSFPRQFRFDSDPRHYFQTEFPNSGSQPTPPSGQRSLNPEAEYQDILKEIHGQLTLPFPVKNGRRYVVAWQNRVGGVWPIQFGRHCQSDQRHYYRVREVVATAA